MIIEDTWYWEPWGHTGTVQEAHGAVLRIVFRVSHPLGEPSLSQFSAFLHPHVAGHTNSIDLVVPGRNT